ncbi:MAG: phosphorylase [Methylococcaceae bacterium]|nr:phosphorylase [Methylococcaceae bacterium]
MITGIIIALPDEVNSLTSKKINKGDCVFINENTVVCCSGAGPTNAAIASQLLIDKGAKRLVSWGCAAALSSDLKPGDLVLPQQLQSESKQLLSIDSPWLIQVSKQLSTLQPNNGLLAESAVIVAESTAKKAINLQSNAIALDMESIAIAQTARQHDLPVIVIRCIADPVDMSLPKAVSYALNEQGDVVLPNLLWFLLTHPTELPGLIKLGLHFNAAKNKLKLVAKHLDIIVGFDLNTANK